MPSFTAKEIIELLGAVAAVIAAIASLVSASKSSKAKTESEEAKRISQEIRSEIKTHVLTSLDTVVRQTQALQQAQNQNINITFPLTAAQGLASSAPILEPQERAQAPHLPTGERADRREPEP
jgi:mevalonate kinase